MKIVPPEDGDLKMVVYGVYHEEEGPDAIRYVGKTKKALSERVYYHKWDFERSVGASKRPLYKWIGKYGLEQICVRVLQSGFQSSEDCVAAEIEWIDRLQTFAPLGKGGLNATIGGEGVHGYVLTKEDRARISERTRGERNPFYGKTHTAETLAKIAAKRPDHSGKNNPFYGKTHTPEVMEKIIAANIGRQQSDSERANKSIAFRGEKNPAAFLSEKQVIEIYTKYGGGASGVTQKSLGLEYGVNQVTISTIVTGKAWKHLGLKPLP